MTELDPQTVVTAREIVHKHLTIDGITVTPADIVGAVKAYFGDGTDFDTLQSWCLALRAELARSTITATVSWPDEQPTAEQDSDALTAAYRERAHLVALLAAVYPSRWGYDPNATEWRIVYVDLPTGQASWHISPADIDLFPHVTEDGGDRDWDGHTTAAKYERIRHLTAQTHAAGKLGAANAAALEPMRAAARRLTGARGAKGGTS